MEFTQHLIDDFHQFERYKNNRVWPIIRYAVFYYITSESYHYKKNVNANKVQYLKDILLSIKSLFYLFKKIDVIVIDGGRSTNIGGLRRNQTSLAFTQALSSELSIVILDITGNVDKNSYPGIRVIDISKYVSLSRHLSIFFRKKDWNQCISNINKEVYKYYSKEIDLSTLFSNVYIHQKSISIFINRIIRLHKLKAIFYSDNGSLSIPIKVANDLGVPTIDYQHSIVSDLNILYSHDVEFVQRYRDYLSSYVMTYGSFWDQFYSKVYKTIPVGNIQQDFVVEETHDIKKSKNCLTIVSGIISRPVLIELALEISRRIPDSKIFYKLRPEEYQTWHDIYPSKIKDCKNIEFIDSESKSLYYYLKKSEYIIGVNSTVLIEALKLSKIIIFKTGWYREMEIFINSGMVLLASNSNDVISIINTNKKPDHAEDINSIFKSNTINNIRSKTQSLIAGE